MALDLVNPAPNPSPKTALHISQRAPQVLASTAKQWPWPLSLFTSTETPETWQTLETLYLSCLRTGDDASARQLLDRLIARFGDKSERVMAYQVMYEEARASDQNLMAVFKELSQALEADPTNLPLQKRRITMLKSMGKLPEATSQLVDLVEYSPVDAEAWAELADLYVLQGCWDQAIFALEEVLLIVPNAWSMHARLAEVIHLAAVASEGGADQLTKGLSESMRRYCRSIELCNSYLRGYYGLALTTQKLIDILPDVSRSKRADDASNDLGLPSMEAVQKLNELATAKLAEIVRKIANGDTDFDGLDEAEVIGARELLGRKSIAIER